MNDTIDGCRVTGHRLDGRDIYDPKLDVVMLRARIGMVFQKPNPFRKSIYDNVAYGRGSTARAQSTDLDAIVDREPGACGLWK